MALLVVDSGWERPWISLVSEEGILFDAVMTSSFEDMGEFFKSAVSDCLHRCANSYASPSAVSFSCGPGKFSALRSGEAFCRGLGFSLGVPVFGWPATLAMSCKNDTGIFTAVVSESASTVRAVLKRVNYEGCVENLAEESLFSYQELRAYCSLNGCNRVITSRDVTKEKLDATFIDSSCKVQFADRDQESIYQAFLIGKNFFYNPEINYGSAILFSERIKK